MDKLKIQDLLKLEDYAAQRQRFRARVMEHKNNRRLHLGPHLTLLFEDRLTIQYQVQEMLHIERIFERKGIQDELDAYNPLIPDGSNWKASLLIEYPDPQERKRKLTELKGIEDRVWARIGDGERIAPIADEDLPRETETKTSAVHFLRFELPRPVIETLRAGASLAFGVDHPAYRHVEQAPAGLREALLADLDY